MTNHRSSCLGGDCRCRTAAIKPAVLAALRETANARLRYEIARTNWERSVRDAVEAGATYREIEAATGYYSLAQLVRIVHKQRQKDSRSDTSCS